jgi:hypothetical protein
MTTSDSSPKYRIRQVSPKSTRNSSQTLKNSFAGSTVTLRIPDDAIVKPVTSRTPAGIESDRREQPVNARSPSIETRQSGANLTLARLQQSLKQDAEIDSIDEGRQIDSSEQWQNADSPRFEI